MYENPDSDFYDIPEPFRTFVCENGRALKKSDRSDYDCITFSKDIMFLFLVLILFYG